MGCFQRTGARRRSAPRSHGQPGTPTRSTGTAITATRRRRRSSCRPRAATAGIPYAAFTSAGYGDDGYRDPGYQGPAAQDAGIAGTRTVRGFVDSGPGLGPAGLPGPRRLRRVQLPAGLPAGPGIRPVRLRRVELRAGRPDRDGVPADRPVGRGIPRRGQPPAAVGLRPAAPLRRRRGRLPGAGRVPGERRLPERQLPQRRLPDRGLRRRPPGPGLRPAYNGSEYSTPGIGGNGYDLAGIIGTSDFEAVGYDEPSYDRLAYDDPRYGEGHGYATRAPRSTTRASTCRASTRPGSTTCGCRPMTSGRRPPRSATGMTGSPTARSVRDTRILVPGRRATGSPRPGST